MNAPKTYLPNNTVSLDREIFKTSDEDIEFSIIPNGSPRRLENATKFTGGSEIGPKNQETSFVVDIKKREVTTMVPHIDTSTDIQYFQEQSVQNAPTFAQKMRARTERIKLMSERNGRENAAMLEKMETLSSQISESLKDLDEKSEAFEETCQRIDQKKQLLQHECLNQLQKINQSLEEAKEKVTDMNLQLAQVESSTDICKCEQEIMVQQLKITHNNFQEIVNCDASDFTNSIGTFSIENDEIKKIISLISKADEL